MASLSPIRIEYDTNSFYSTSSCSTPMDFEEYIKMDMEKHLQKQPSLSIFGPYSDESRDEEHSESTLNEPPVPSDTTLRLDVSNLQTNEDDEISFSVQNMTVDYREFKDHKMWITFDVVIHDENDQLLNGSNLDLLLYPFTKRQHRHCNHRHNTLHQRQQHRRFDALNLYSKIHTIQQIKDTETTNSKISPIHPTIGSSVTPIVLYRYRVTALLAITRRVPLLCDRIEVLIGWMDAPQYRCTLTVPITYFSILEDSMLGTVRREHGVSVLHEMYTLIMEFSGSLHWILGDPLIVDSLDLEDESKVNIDALDPNITGYGVQSEIKCVWCVDGGTSIPIRTELKGMNLLMFNADSNAIETVTVPIRNRRDYLCLLHQDSYDDDSGLGVVRYDGRNNVILKKYLALDLDLRKLRNGHDRLEFMCWIEWGESELEIECRRWTTRRNESMMSDFRNLIDWYELKRKKEEQDQHVKQMQRMISVKEQRIQRQKDRNRHFQCGSRRKPSKQCSHRQRWR